MSEQDKKILSFGQSAMDSFLSKMISYMNLAIQTYKKSMKEKFDRDSKDPWILFLVTDDERNVID